MSRPTALATATSGILGALVAKRDAERMLRLGYFAATEVYSRMVDGTRRAKALTFNEAIELQAASIAEQSVECYDRDPARHPEGRTADAAMDHALAAVRSSYHGGKCKACGASALRCARYGARNGNKCPGT